MNPPYLSKLFFYFLKRLGDLKFKSCTIHISYFSLTFVLEKLEKIYETNLYSRFSERLFFSKTILFTENLFLFNWKISWGRYEFVQYKGQNLDCYNRG